MFLPVAKRTGLKSACIVEHIYANLIVLQLAGFVVLSLRNKQATQGEVNTKLSDPLSIPPAVPEESSSQSSC